MLPLLLFVIACSKDDDGGTTITDTVSIDEKTYDITKAVIVDVGVTENNFYDYEFYLEGKTETEEFEVYLDVYSKIVDGKEEFTPGTFKVGGSDKLLLGGLEFTERVNDYTEGTVTIEGKGTNFSIAGTTTLEGGEKLVFSYDGNFILEED